VRALLALSMPLILCCAACSTPAPAPKPVLPPPAEDAVAVGEGVTLAVGTVDAPALDLVVEVFDRGLDTAGSGSVFPNLRKAESIVLPVKLAQQLRDSGNFGAVRVVRSGEVSAPLRVAGSIVHADGLLLELDLELLTADGRRLLQRRYRDESRDSDYPVAAGADPFGDLYRRAANDLAAAVQTLEPAARRSLERLTLLRLRVRELAPTSFADYTAEGDDGVRELRKYPAADDPMLARLQRLRRQEALFVDTVDEQYRELVQRISESYALWRQYTRELALYGATYRDEAAARDRDGRRGSFAALQQAYGSYRKVKLQEEDLLDLVDAFAGESLESVMAVDDGVVRLSGSVDQRYAEWQRLLARIYRLETGAQAP
jgi:hypothetical protein